MSAKTVTVKVSSVGQHFGVCGIVYDGRKKVHVTDTYASDSGGAAFEAAESWADRSGYLTRRGLDALTAARLEYSRTVAASVRHPSADGRRVLTSEHCALAAAIQLFQRHRGAENLENVTAECRRVRAMWQGA
jgi:hypothetical protein